MQMHSFDIPLQAIRDEITRKNGIHLYVLRLDINHEHISGNKLFKLKYNLEEAKRSDKKILLTFGGAFSNHIAATAAAGMECGFKTIGMIRGEKTDEPNATLTFAASCGMELHYISRGIYRQKNDLNLLCSILPELNMKDIYVIPEGGANNLGVKGCREITGNIHTPFDKICCACGTGTTLAGIILSLKQGQEAIGFQVLKGEGYMKAEVEKWLNESGSETQSWNINEDYHFGGYARIKPELINFMDWFKSTHGIPLDYIYTGKMMFGIYDMIQKGRFALGETIIAVHTGGLQGNDGFTA
jgi:1-aminocyclopropane-1-carboxylate deaminase